MKLSERNTNNYSGNTNLKDFRIYGICMVKNEEDIIKECLDHASTFCKKIFVYDTGSTDKTWDIVQELSLKGVVVPFKRESIPFRNGLRSVVFKHYESWAKPGDWWYILDADEFLAEDPRDFINKKVKNYETVIWTKHICYYYTDKDYQKWKSGEEGSDSRNVSIVLRRRYYKCDHSEPRLFKHREEIAWDINNSVPSRIGVVARNRVLLRHYKWRDPEQIVTRMRVRRNVDSSIEKGWAGIDLDNFESHIAESGSLTLDKGDGNYICDEKLLTRHIEKWWRRAIKMALYFLIFKKKHISKP